MRGLASIFDLSVSRGLLCIDLTPMRTLFCDGVCFLLLFTTARGLSGGVSSPGAFDTAALRFECSVSQLLDSSVLRDRLLLTLSGLVEGPEADRMVLCRICGCSRTNALPVRHSLLCDGFQPCAPVLTLCRVRTEFP